MGGPLRYEQFVEDALRGVVRRALETVSETGLPGNHHLYITFLTRHDGVDIPDYLAAQYPEEMTIVLQHQYWGLEIDAVRFSITLSFNKVHERLTVPFAAITAFADPSVNFGLQFKAAALLAAARTDGKAAPLAGEARRPPRPSRKTDMRLASGGKAEAADATAAETAAEDSEHGEGDDNVVALDAFRKK
ncbi:MAG: ClpXP protease specificity-enhancing factor SspB [Alphaproteobacteria bacterium]